MSQDSGNGWGGGLAGAEGREGLPALVERDVAVKWKGLGKQEGTSSSQWLVRAS